MHYDHICLHYNESVLVQWELGAFIAHSCSVLQTVLSFPVLEKCCVGTTSYIFLSKIKPDVIHFKLWNGTGFPSRKWEGRHSLLALKFFWLLLILDLLSLTDPSLSWWCNLNCCLFQPCKVHVLTLTALLEVALWVGSLGKWSGENMSAFPHPKKCTLCGLGFFMRSFRSLSRGLLLFDIHISQ